MKRTSHYDSDKMGGSIDPLQGQLEVLTHWHVGFFSIPAGQVPARFEFKVEWVASDTLDSRYSILMFQHYLHMGNHTN